MPKSDFRSGDGESDPLIKPKSYFGSRDRGRDPSVPKSDFDSGDGEGDPTAPKSSWFCGWSEGFAQQAKVVLWLWGSGG